MYVQQNALEW
jgi:hypothetical protein